MSKFLPLFLIVTVALGASTAAQAEVYKWVDSEGVTHYSQQPPEAGTAKEIPVPRPAAAPAAEPQAASPTEAPIAKDRASELTDEIRARRTEEDRQQAEADLQRAEACEKMRANLETLQTRARVRVEEEGGSRVLTPEEQAQRIIDLEKQIQDNCSQDQ